MPRIQGLVDTLALTGSEVLKSVEGYVFSITFAWEGATAGQKVYFRDGSDVTASARIVLIVPTANGTITKEWPNGKKFDSGIFYDEGQINNGYMEVTYK
jgi:hypothetical protein